MINFIELGNNKCMTKMENFAGFRKVAHIMNTLKNN